jgi:5-formyltetrahydrofolate cyclo-ligase
MPFRRRDRRVAADGAACRRGLAHRAAGGGGPGRPLVFRAWAPGEPTVAGAWSIPVPPDSAPEVEPDVLLVPMLAFDGAGFRLGYGGGFYDRTLRPCAPSSRCRGGRGLRRPGGGAGAARAHDEPLDWILTEHGPSAPAATSVRSCG